MNDLAWFLRIRFTRSDQFPDHIYGPIGGASEQEKKGYAQAVTDVLSWIAPQLAALEAELERERASRQDWAIEAMRLEVELEEANHRFMEHWMRSGPEPRVPAGDVALPDDMDVQIGFEPGGSTFREWSGVTAPNQGDWPHWEQQQHERTYCEDPDCDGHGGDQ